MTSLPIVERELRVISRRPETYWVRAGVAAVAVSVFLLMLITTGSRNPSRLGPELLDVLKSILLVFALLSGILMTADTISTEKREGTVGLLFLTDLKPIDIILGKLAAHATTTFLMLTAVLPVLCLPLLLGGVTFGESLRIVLVLVLSMTLSLCIGITVSTFATNATRAYLSAFVLLLMLVGGPLFLWMLAEVATNGRAGNDHLAFQLSPVFAMISSRGGVGYWKSVGLVAASSTTLLTIAAWTLPRTWSDAPKTDRPRKKRPRANRAPPRLRERVPISDRTNPFEWRREQTLRLSRVGNGAFLTLTAFWGVAMIIALGTQNYAEGFSTACVAAFLAHLTLKLLVILESTRPVFQEARNGEMELVLATPITTGELIQGHMGAVRRHFRRWTRWVSALNVLMFLSIVFFWEHLRMQHGAGAVFSTYILGGLAVLRSDLHGIRWTGYVQALQAVTHVKGVLRVMLPTLVWPWLGIVLAFMFAASTRQEEEALIGWGCVWFLICFYFNAVRAGRARRALHKLRTLVCETPGR